MQFLNFIKTFFRTIIRHSGYSLITLLGLSIGMAMSLLVLIYVYYETNYDSQWSNSENIFRTYSYGQIGGDVIRSAVTPLPLSELLERQQGVVMVTKLTPGNKALVSSTSLKSMESGFHFADKNFFKVFDLPFIYGDRLNALADSNSVVVTISTANRFFGKRNPIGEKLWLEDGLEYVVSGVVQDVPSNSHLKFDFIANWLLKESFLKNNPDLSQSAMLDNWLYLNSYVYFELENNSDALRVLEELSSKAVEKVDMQISTSFSPAEEASRSIFLNFGIKNIQDIHLYSDLDNEMSPVVNKGYIMIFTFIAFLILVITAVNFMNLTTAKAARRYKEVAVRKYFGAGRRYLVYQFLTEAVVYSFIALFVALVLVELLLPGINRVFNLSMSSEGFILQPDIVWVLVITMLLGILSGSYPAMFFSGLKPHLAINGAMKVKKWGLVIRGLTVSMQVMLSMCLLVLSMGMYSQLRFLEMEPHGFDAHDAITLEWGSMNDQVVDKFTEELELSKTIKSFGVAEYAPGDEASVISFREYGDSSNVVLLAVNYVDSGYFNAMGAEFIEGRVWKSEDEVNTSEVVINHAAAELLGYYENKDMTLELVGGRNDDEPYLFKVSGVIKDIYFAGVNEDARAMVFFRENSTNTAQHMIIRFNSGSLSEGVEIVRSIWLAEIPDRAMNIKYLSDIKDDFYSEDRRFGKIAFMFSALALVLTIFGKIGLAAFVVQYYRKNIFIRKILAAPFVRLLFYSLRYYWFYVLSALVLALPVSAFLLRLWLSNFNEICKPTYLIYIFSLLILLTTSVVVAYLIGGREIKKGAHS